MQWHWGLLTLILPAMACETIKHAVKVREFVTEYQNKAVFITQQKMVFPLKLQPLDWYILGLATPIWPAVHSED